MAGSPRLAAIRRIASCYLVQGRRPASRAWMAAFQRITATGSPEQMLLPAAMMRRKPGWCRK